MKKCLVLGASGFIGKPLTQELTKECKVRAYSYDRVEEFEKNEAIESVVGDFTKEEAFDDLLEGVDTVYHLICTTLPVDRTDHIPQEIQNNIVPTVKLLEAMVRCNVKNIVFSSSGGTVYGEAEHGINREEDPLDPKSSYGLQKCIIEQYMKFYGEKYDIHYKIARIANPYGVGQNINKPQGVIPIFINRILNDQEITIFGDGNNIRDYIYMDDVVEALIKFGKYDGKEHIMNIGSGKGNSLNELLDIMKQVSGKEIQVKYIENRNCDVRKSVLDISRIQEELNWSPKINLMQGIERLYSSITKL